MTYALDPELVTVMEALAQRSRNTPRPRRGDWQALRDIGNAGQAYLATLVPPSSGVHNSTYVATAADGASLELRWYTTDTAGPGSAVVYAHGGGFVFCDLDSHDELCRNIANRVPAVVISVGYRLAPENRWPAAAEDFYAAARWAADNADAVDAFRPGA